MLPAVPDKSPHSPPSVSDPRFAVLGAGSWGTALALLLARNGHPVSLWAHRQAHVDAIKAEGENRRYLPGCAFPPHLNASADLDEVLAFSDELLVVVPSHAFAETLRAVQGHDLSSCRRIAWATKGVEPGSGRFLHQQAEEICGDIPLALITGPTFAGEVGRGLPTALTVASNKRDFANAWADWLHNDHTRAYTTDDLIGAQLGGAVKNVLAIAAGIADGLGFGANSRAALITRGLAELKRLGAELGARRETLVGLSGLGDLLLTSTDNQSRNRRLGLALGQGKTIAQAAEEIGQVLEGPQSAREVLMLARRHWVEMPITEVTCKVLFEGMAPLEAVQALFAREIKAED